MIAVISVAYRKKDIAVVSNVLSASIVLWMFSFTTYYSLIAIAELAVVVLPLFFVFETTYVERHAKDSGIQSDKRQHKVFAPILYAALFTFVFVFLTQNSLYRRYFVASGHEFLQLLIIISVATILFVSFYARFN